MKKRFFTDPRDGKTYRTVKIGDQVWMAENLNYAGPNGDIGRYYDNDPAYGEKYGRLYTLKEAKKICPPGWHLPSREEWETLVNFAGGEKIAGGKLKAKNGWNNKDDDTSGNGTDEFGFSALPGGNGNSDGCFGTVGYYGYWWGTTANSICAYNCYISYNNENALWTYIFKNYPNSVRCLKDKN